MACVRVRKNKEGKTIGYQAIIRLKDGFPDQSKVFPTKQEAKDWAKQEEAKRRLGLHFPNQQKLHTLAELIGRYIETILPTEPKDAYNKLRQLNWWKEKLGAYALQHLTPDLIAKHRQELAKGLTPRGNVRTSATVNRYLAALSVVLTYGVKECGWLAENPALKVAKMKEPRGRDRFLSEEEISRLIHSAKKSKSPYLYPIIILALTTGMRQGEILSLTWDALDFKNSVITLRETKNGELRVVPLTPSTRQLLWQLHNKKQGLRVFVPRKRFGKTLTIRTAWEEALKRADIQNFRFHDLRHTFASHLAKKGVTHIELAEALGHKTLQMVHRYSHLDIKHKHKIVECLEPLIKSMEH